MTRQQVMSGSGEAARPKLRARCMLVIPLLLFTLSVTLPIRAESPFALRDGDRVLFYGDEVTAVQFYDNAQEPRLYPTFVETYVATRFPAFHITFVDSAWNGDRVSGGAGGSINVRLQRDVFPYKPTVLTIMLGMNDALTTTFYPKDHEAFTTGYNIEIDPAAAMFDARRFADYSSGYSQLLEKIKDALPDTRVTLLKPLYYDDATQPANFGGYNRELLRYAAWIDGMGEREHVLVIDPAAALNRALSSANYIDPAAASEIIPDHLHPSAAAHLIIAETLLTAWHAPALVSDVEIDVPGGRVVCAENSTVHELRGGEDPNWTQTDKALPFPLDLSDPAIALIVRSSDFVQALDQQILKVDGLSAPHYELRIDGKSVGTFDAQQLQAGINLALLDTPMKKQAARVFHLVQERENVHFGKWKRVMFPLEGLSLAHKQRAIEALTTLEQDLQEEQHAAAQPRSHHYELHPTNAANTARRLP